MKKILLLTVLVVFGHATTTNDWILPSTSFVRDKEEFLPMLVSVGFKTVARVTFVTNTFKASPPEDPGLICTISNRFAIVVVPKMSTNKVFIESIGCFCEEKN